MSFDDPSLPKLEKKKISVRCSFKVDVTLCRLRIWHVIQLVC